MVGDRPVIVCWGYEKEAAAGLLPAALPQPPLPGPAAHRAVLEAPIPAAVPVLRPPPGTTIPWARTLLRGAAIAASAAGRRLAAARAVCRPIPALSLATREGPDAPPAPEPAPDPMPALKAAFSNEQSRGRMLKIELALIEAELKKRIADCKPPEAPKPPPAGRRSRRRRRRKPRQARARPGAAAAPPGPTTIACACRRRRPTTTPSCRAAGAPIRSATRPIQPQPGISSYCFDANGNGQLEWRRGRTACRTRAQARFDGGGVLRLRDADTTCNDGSHWYADQLVCRRGADDVAQCSGTSRGAFGPVSWTVNLHKLN